MNVPFPSLFSSHVALCMFILYPHFCSCDGVMNLTTGSTIKVGALVASNTIIGKVAQRAIELAVRDVNEDSSLLHGTQFVVRMLDTNCSGIQGAAAAMELLEEEVVAIVGPQSSTVSYFTAHMGSATQVPFVSFGATDPTLAESQYPYFFRVAHSDAAQMAAVAAVIGYYGWRQVIVLYTDDDYGNNGIIALGDTLTITGSTIAYKAAMAPGINRTSIGIILSKLATMDTRVFVVHMQQNVGLTLLSEANYLGMMNQGFAWIVTDAIAVSLDTMYLTSDALKSTQGIIGTRRYVPESPRHDSFLAEREKLHGQELEPSELNVYELFAYDSVWVIAYAMDRYLKKGWSFKFDNPSILPKDGGGSSELAQLKVSSGGSQLRQEILQTAFNGTSGLIKFDDKGDLVGSAFEIVNMVGKGLRVVGYWTKKSGISVYSSDVVLATLENSTSPLARLLDVIWPGGKSQIPKGWAVPENGEPLKIGVPRKVGYKEIVGEVTDSNNVTKFQGFCIDVFEYALKYLPFYVPHKFVPYGNGLSTPSYDELIEQLANKVFDAVVGDITITMKRLELVDFTQPYKEAGLVVIAPLKSIHGRKLWDFLLPFTTVMWLTICACFVFTGAVMWMLEHKMNDHFRGHPKKQISTTLGFIFSTLFFSQQEKTLTTLGRTVIIIWLFVVLIITSSYTASLTSILTVDQLVPSFQGINSLLSSDDPVGYQTGSFAREYLIALGMDGTRLKPFSSVEMYAEALKLWPKDGGVAAVIDELPYAQLFLSSECDFQIAGHTFTTGEWGFTFPKGSQLTTELSKAILTMAANGDIHRIYELWFSGGQCTSESNEVHSSQLNVDSFWGLFLIMALTSIICLLLYIVRLLWEFNKRTGSDRLDSSGRGSSVSRAVVFMKDFVSYVDKPAPGKGNGKKKKRKREIDENPAAMVQLEVQLPS